MKNAKKSSGLEIQTYFLNLSGKTVVENVTLFKMRPNTMKQLFAEILEIDERCIDCNSAIKIQNGLQFGFTIFTFNANQNNDETRCERLLRIYEATLPPAVTTATLDDQSSTSKSSNASFHDHDQLQTPSPKNSNQHTRGSGSGVNAIQIVDGNPSTTVPEASQDTQTETEETGQEIRGDARSRATHVQTESRDAETFTTGVETPKTPEIPKTGQTLETGQTTQTSQPGETAETLSGQTIFGRIRAVTSMGSFSIGEIEQARRSSYKRDRYYIGASLFVRRAIDMWQLDLLYPESGLDEIDVRLTSAVTFYATEDKGSHKGATVNATNDVANVANVANVETNPKNSSQMQKENAQYKIDYDRIVESHLYKSIPDLFTFKKVGIFETISLNVGIKVNVTNEAEKAPYLSPIRSYVSNTGDAIIFRKLTLDPASNMDDNFNQKQNDIQYQSRPSKLASQSRTSASLFLDGHGLKPKMDSSNRYNNNSNYKYMAAKAGSTRVDGIPIIGLDDVNSVNSNSDTTTTRQNYKMVNYNPFDSHNDNYNYNYNHIDYNHIEAEHEIIDIGSPDEMHREVTNSLNRNSGSLKWQQSRPGAVLDFAAMAEIVAQVQEENDVDHMKVMHMHMENGYHHHDDDHDDDDQDVDWNDYDNDNNNKNNVDSQRYSILFPRLSNLKQRLSTLNLANMNVNKNTNSRNRNSKKFERNKYGGAGHGVDFGDDYNNHGNEYPNIKMAKLRAISASSTPPPINENEMHD